MISEEDHEDDSQGDSDKDESAIFKRANRHSNRRRDILEGLSSDVVVDGASKLDSLETDQIAVPVE
jgi:hypothetical protein